MNHNSIADSLWADTDFRKLGVNGKLLLICLLTSPLKSYSGIFFASYGMMSEYSGLTKAETVKAISELCETRFILYCDEHVIIRNHMKFNSFGADTHKKGLIKDMGALQESVFALAVSVPIIYATYHDACDKLHIAARQVVNRTSDLIAEHAPIKAKSAPVAKNAITESEEITRLRGYADAVLSDFTDVKHAKNTLTTEQYQKLLDKYGMVKLTIMQKVYFGWKAGKAKAPTTTDYGTLIAGTWVAERADEILSKEPKNEQPQASEWTYSFLRPVGFENWSRNDKSNYITSGGKTIPNGGSNA